MKKFKILVCMTVLLSGLSALCADPLDFKNAVGVFLLGNISTTPHVKGLQYQRWITNSIGFQTEGYVSYDSKVYTDLQQYDFSVSGEFLVKLYETPHGYKFGSTLYAWALAGFHGFNKINYTYESDIDGEYYTPGYNWDTGFKGDVMLGIGFGFDVMLFDHISIPLQFGFEGEFPNDISAGFCLGSGIRYKF